MEERDDFQQRGISGDDREALARVPPELRPCKIFHFYVRHLGRNDIVPDWETGIERLAERLGFSKNRVKEISEGFAPTSHEIDIICKKMNWSIFFVFGVKKEALEIRREQFFSAIGVEKPTRKQYKEFDQLYQRLLKSRSPQRREGK